MKYNTPTPEELEYLESIRHIKRYSPDDRVKLYAAYNRIFNENIRPSSCGNCLAKRHGLLMKVLDENK